jgi:hypothetical protein
VFFVVAGGKALPQNGSEMPVINSNNSTDHSFKSYQKATTNTNNFRGFAVLRIFCGITNMQFTG